MAGRYGRNSVPSTPGFEPDSPGSGAFSPSESRGSATSPKRGRSRADNDQREVYGLKLGLLRQWENEKKDQLLSSEHALQEIAVAKVRGFLDAIGRRVCWLQLRTSLLNLLFAVSRCRLCGEDSVVVAYDGALSRTP
jgi:hypothetical protein